MERTIIAVSGRKRAGKDCFAQVVKEQLGEARVARVAFADPLKHEASQFLDGENWDGVCLAITGLMIESGMRMDILKQMVPMYKENNGKSFSKEELFDMFNSDAHKGFFRLYLQAWGTEFRRHNFGDDYWLKAWSREVAALPETVTHVVVTDCRFPNEFEFLYCQDACMVKVIRTITETSEDAHISEHALADEQRWDFVLANEGTVEEYTELVKDTLCMMGDATVFTEEVAA